MEGDDLVTLLNFVGNEKLSPSFPASWSRGCLPIQIALKLNKVLGKLLVRCSPSINSPFVSRVTKDAFDRRQKSLADNRIQLWGNSQTSMFVTDARNGGLKCGWVVNIQCIRPDSMRKGSWLFACFLMRRVEDIFDLGMRVEKSLVEEGRDCDSVLFKCRGRRLNNFDLLRCEIPSWNGLESIRFV